MTESILLSAAMGAELPGFNTFPSPEYPSHLYTTLNQDLSSTPYTTLNDINSYSDSSDLSLISPTYSSDDSAYFGSPKSPITALTSFSFDINQPTSSITPQYSWTPQFTSETLEERIDQSAQAAKTFPNYDYTHPTYLENLQNKIMRRKGAQGTNKEQSTLNYLKSLSREERYNEVFLIISNFSFTKNNHSWLQTLWLRGHYAQETHSLGRPLLPADRLRLRRCHPFPSTITEPDDYESQVYAKGFLKAFYSINEYPTPEDKKLLSKRCSLTYHQVNSWFKNRRARDREPTTTVKRSQREIDATLDALFELIDREMKE